MISNILLSLNSCDPVDFSARVLGSVNFFSVLEEKNVVGVVVGSDCFVFFPVLMLFVSIWLMHWTWQVCVRLCISTVQ